MTTSTIPHDFAVGDRIQMHPATDAWMRGDRYGEVVKLLRGGAYKVKLDVSGLTKTVTPENIYGAAG
jgi:ribosomal protein L21E